MKRRYCVLKHHDIKPQNRNKGKIMDEVTVYKNRGEKTPKCRDGNKYNQRKNPQFLRDM